MHLSLKRFVITGLEAIRTAWLIVGVTLLLLLLLEATVRVRQFIAERPRGAPRTYVAGDPRASNWFAEYRRDFDATRSLQWRPYVYFRRQASASRHFITIDSLGHRVTPQPARPAKPLARVFLFGGSTMWGEPQREDHTIAAELSRRLQPLAGPDARIEVTNFAETAWVFTQELVQLILELRAGGRPDVVVFYDGINDVAATVQRGVAGDPQNEFNRTAEFALGRALDRGSYAGWLEKDLRPIAVLEGMAMKRLALVRWAQSKKSAPTRAFISADSAARSEVRVYAENARLVEMLAAHYGFSAVYVWQPNLHASEKRLDPYEQDLRRQIESDPFQRRMQEMHRLISPLLDSAMRGVAPGRFVNAAGLFKDDPQPVYIDRIGHTTEGAIPAIVASFWPTLETAMTRRLARPAATPQK